MNQYILALDQGTTNSRAILFDRAGRIAGQAQRELTQIYPQPGWVEHDPAEILATQREVAHAAATGKGAIAAMGITNQRETTILWDRATGKPVYNAIVWQDRRTAEWCRRFTDVEPTVRAKTGLLLDPYFSAGKIAWILDNVPGTRTSAEAGSLAFGTVDSWLVWNLTGGKNHVTDRTNAARTMLYNIVDDRWDEELLKLFDIPASLLPEVVWSSESIGRTDPALGFGEIEIAGIAGDQQAALFGQLCVAQGDTKCTYGTGCFLLTHSGGAFTLSGQRLITTLACSLARKKEYALEGSMFTGGAVVQWLRDNMKFVAHAAEIETLASSVADAGNVVFVPAFTGLGAPHWDPQASGMIIGLDRGTTHAHIARAALESIAFQVCDVLHAMEADTGLKQKALRVDGGAAADDLLMQFQTDMLGVPIERRAIVESTALGAAYLAGLAIGFWRSIEEIATLSAPPTIFAPRMARDEAVKHYARWQDAVGRAKGWNR